MIDVALLGIIRRWYIRDRISIREIARRLDISRNTVRRSIRTEAIEPSYPSRKSSSSLDEFAPQLTAWLSAEAVKSRKQRRTLKQMFLDLKELGYKGSYDRVAAFGRRWKVGQMERVNSASKSTIWDAVDDIRNGKITPLLVQNGIEEAGVYAVFHATKYMPPRVRAKIGRAHV